MSISHAERQQIVQDVVDTLKKRGRMVIVGASLAGLRGAEGLRDAGFTGKLTIIGDELHEPYDRPPLSKQVLKGWVPAGNTKLPRLRAVDADWKLGVAATGLDRANRIVRLENDEEVPYDRLLIATGVRSRPWPNPAEAALKGVCTLRTIEDADDLQKRLAAGPRRVLIIGAGFIGCEVASVCRQLDLEVTVAERAAQPMAGVLGNVVGKIAADIQRAHGVDLRLGVSVLGLDGDAAGNVRQARLSDGTALDCDVVLASLGSLRNTEWLDGAGLATGFWGVACDAGCRAFDIHGVVTDNIFVAGDLARAPQILYEYQFLAMEHWDNAVLGAAVAANNMVSDETTRRPLILLPHFWSGQFGINIKGVGVPGFGDEIMFTQGSPKDGRFAAVYGHRGRVVGAVTFDHGKWLEYYRKMIEKSAPFPPPPAGYDVPVDGGPMPADFPARGVPTGTPDIVLTGHDPNEMQAEYRPRPRSNPAPTSTATKERVS